jgi:hypothetical protein
MFVSADRRKGLFDTFSFTGRSGLRVLRGLSEQFKIKTNYQD